MLESSSKRKLMDLIQILPEEEIRGVTRFVEFILSQISPDKELSPEEFYEVLDTLPYTDEELTEEDRAAILEAEKEIERGEYLTLEDYDKERGLV